YGGGDGELQRGEAGPRGPLDQIVGGLPAAHHVQLEPPAAVGRGGRDVLDGGGAQRREREGDSGGLGGAGAGDLALGLHQAREAGGRDRERHRAGAAEHLAGGVDRGDVV